jgi:DNA-binding LytR/AlgR family response regulator
MIEIVAKVKSPIQAIEVFQLNAIDLLYLDIQMPTINGNQLLKTLPYQPITIFTTAYSEYAVEAFELGAIDYLVKPFFV